MERYRASSTKNRCEAMADAGIEDPESQEGKDFCTKKCPYPLCVVCEVGRGSSTMRREGRAARAKALVAKGLSVSDIARELGVSVRTVEGYLAK